MTHKKIRLCYTYHFISLHISMQYCIYKCICYIKSFFYSWTKPERKKQKGLFKVSKHQQEKWPQVPPPVLLPKRRGATNQSSLAFRSGRFTRVPVHWTRSTPGFQQRLVRFVGCVRKRRIHGFVQWGRKRLPWWQPEIWWPKKRLRLVLYVIICHKVLCFLIL